MTSKRPPKIDAQTLLALADVAHKAAVRDYAEVMDREPTDPEYRKAWKRVIDCAATHIEALRKA